MSIFHQVKQSRPIFWQVKQSLPKQSIVTHCLTWSEFSLKDAYSHLYINSLFPSIVMNAIHCFCSPPWASRFSLQYNALKFILNLNDFFSHFLCVKDRGPFLSDFLNMGMTHNWELAIYEYFHPGGHRIPANLTGSSG